MTRRTGAAQALSSARHSSRQYHIAALQEEVWSTESAQVPMPVPARSVQIRQSPRRPLSRRSRALRGNRAVRFLGVVILPVTLLSQGFSNILGHVGLIVFGEHGIGFEGTGGIEHAFRNHALPFAE